MLDDRKTAILSAVVQEYIATAQPVGSSHIARAPGVGVSSATVRNEMSVLEQDGYLVQPHTSAGRIPTDKGYRFFVDHLAKPGRADAMTTRQVGDFFAAAHGRLEEMLHQTSDLLTHLTHNAAVVLGPNAGEVAIRNAQIVRLSSTAATVVMVFANGSVANEIVEIDEATSEASLAAATAHMMTHLADTTLSSADIPESGDATVDELCAMALAEIRAQTTDDQAIVGGVSTMAEAFDAVEVVRQVLHTLEQQFVVVSLVRDIVDRGMSVAIGVEHGVEPLSACSVVVAPVVVDGEHIGSVGVLGPTRMNYPQALATVDIVSDQLGRRLGDG
jgi:heat-inducible transcriptional repressor